MRIVISWTKVISWIYFILSSLLAIKLGWIKKKFVKLMLFSFHQISKDGWRKCIWLGNFKSYFTALKKPWILVGITCCSLLKTSLFIFQFIIFVNIKWGLISNLMPYYKNLLHSVQKWNLMRFDLTLYCQEKYVAEIKFCVHVLYLFLSTVLNVDFSQYCRHCLSELPEYFIMFYIKVK